LNRIHKFPIDLVIRPLMQEICNIAKAAGHELPEGIIEETINIDPTDTFFKPSMQQDIEKVRQHHDHERPSFKMLEKTT
jgi:ketopantoate reductase